MTRTQQFADALQLPETDESNQELRDELKRTLVLAEQALMQAKMAIAVGDLESANEALEAAGEAHALAQRIRTGVVKKSAA